MQEVRWDATMYMTDIWRMSRKVCIAISDIENTNAAYSVWEGGKRGETGSTGRGKEGQEKREKRNFSCHRAPCTYMYSTRPTQKAGSGVCLVRVRVLKAEIGSRVGLEAYYITARKWGPRWSNDQCREY